MSIEDRIKECGARDSVAYGIIVLIGERGKHWDYFYDGVDLTWWQFRIALFMWGGYWMPWQELYFTLPLWVRRR